MALSGASRRKQIPCSPATTLALATTALIYEPFDDSDSSLNGNTPGLGLTGTWSASGDFGIPSGSLSYGTLLTSGNRAAKTTTSSFRNASISTGTTLSGGGLLDDGAVLWFSFLAESVSSGRTYLTIGTGGPDGFDRVGGNGGFGLGARLENGQVHAHGWNNTSAIKPSGSAVQDGPVLVVGKITWAAAGSNDTLEIYLPGTDLAEPVSAASTLSFDFDQSTFTTLGFAGGTDLVPEVDEVRFGTSYTSVVPAGGLDDYTTWAGLFPGADLSDPNADFDKDGLTNDEERLFGLDPTSGASVAPISSGLDATAGTLSYTRRLPSLSGASFSYEWSTTLASGGWNEFTPIMESSDSGDPVETVTITLDPSLLANTLLFVRVVASAD